jgi:hypothetical protein
MDLLGKRVLVPIPSRDKQGKVDGGTTTAAGVCRYLGPNEFLGIALQITVDRTPIELQNVSQIKII